jgi:murein DD-endopeptidase MepM/ murein hydrolase activator NlpD
VLGQGVDGGITHKGVERYAFDWVMPIGTPVLAAREGIVVQVIDGFTKGGFDERLRTQWNLVVVGHADGTLASYGHLSKGIPVRIGDHVVRGQRLGLSGNTGYTQGPHLHFHVGKILDDQVEGYTVPIRFDDGSRDGFVPELGSRYGPEVEVAPVGSTRLR